MWVRWGLQPVIWCCNSLSQGIPPDQMIPLQHSCYIKLHCMHRFSHFSQTNEKIFLNLCLKVPGFFFFGGSATKASSLDSSLSLHPLPLFDGVSSSRLPMVIHPKLTMWIEKELSLRRGISEVQGTYLVVQGLTPRSQCSRPWSGN